MKNNLKSRKVGYDTKYRGLQRRESREDLHSQRGMYEEIQFKTNLKNIKINHWAWDDEKETVFWVKLVLDEPVLPQDFKPKLIDLLEGLINGNL